MLRYSNYKPKTMSQKISKRDPYKFLNNLTFTQEIVDLIRHYATSDELPVGLDARQKRKFIARFSKNWEDREGKLWFVPLQLEAVTEGDIDARLAEMYADPVISLGKGINRFYDIVRKRYVGISRQAVTEFLRRQEEYQLTFRAPKKAQKPIFATFANEKWGCDLVDMNRYRKHNQHYRYILTVVDFFSRRAFAEKLKHKDVESVQEAFGRIITDQANGTAPLTLICDNGSEFELEDWCHDKRIRLAHPSSHTPTQNSLTENFNGQLRRLIRANFVRRSDLVWIEDLQMLLDNHNGTKQKLTKFAPNDIWSEGRKRPRIKKIKEEEISTPQDELGDLPPDRDENIEIATDRISDKAEKQLKKLRNQELAVGDHVRVSTSALHTNIRKVEKAGLSKLVVIRFSTRIYVIYKIVKSTAKKKFQTNKYILKTKGGDLVGQEPNPRYPERDQQVQKFDVTELLKVDPNTVTRRNGAVEKKLNNVARVDSSDSEEEVVPRAPRRRNDVQPLEALRPQRARRASAAIREGVNLEDYQL
jgi:transposase InsO family protein